MSDWITVANVADFPLGTQRVVDIDGTSVLVFHHQAHFYAIENVCTHDGGILANGKLEGDTMMCSRHGAKFCIKTGAVMAPPAYEDVSTFAVRVVDGVVQISDNRYD